MKAKGGRARWIHFLMDHVRPSRGAVVPRIYDEVSTLLDGDGLCQVAGLVYVAAAADGYVIRKELKGNDFEQRGEKFRSGGNFDDVVGGFASEAVARRDDGDDDAVAGAYFLDVGDAFFVAGYRVGIVLVMSGEDNDWEIFVDE